MNSNTIIGGIVVLVALIGGYFIFSQPSTSLPEGVVKVGIIAPITGDAAVYGEALRNASLLAVEQINAAGGIDGRNMELIIEDGKCNGKDAASAAQKLVSVDKVAIILGGFCSGESLAAEPVTTAAKVMLVSAGSSNPALTNVSPYFARIYPSDSSQGTILATIAAKEGYKKIAIVQEQTDYAAGVSQAFTKKFTELGGTVVSEEFASKQADFRSVITKFQAAKPDALFVIAQTQAAERLLFTQLKQLSWKTPLLMNDVPAGDKELLAEFAAFLEGTITAEFTADTENPKFKAMVAAYKAKYGAEPVNLAYAQTEWDVIFLAADALRAVGYDGTKLSQWFRTSVKNWQGASGSITIGPDGDPVTGHRAEVIKSGKAVPYTE